MECFRWPPRLLSSIKSTLHAYIYMHMYVVSTVCSLNFVPPTTVRAPEMSQENSRTEFTGTQETRFSFNSSKIIPAMMNWEMQLTLIEI